MSEWARELVLIFMYFSHLKLCNAWYWSWAEGDTSWHLSLKLTFFWVTCLNSAGNSSSAILDGSATMTLLRFGEEYVMSLPYAHCKGEIPILSTSILGKNNVLQNNLHFLLSLWIHSLLKSFNIFYWGTRLKIIIDNYSWSLNGLWVNIFAAKTNMAGAFHY